MERVRRGARWGVRSWYGGPGGDWGEGGEGGKGKGQGVCGVVDKGSGDWNCVVWWLG